MIMKTVTVIRHGTSNRSVFFAKESPESEDIMCETNQYTFKMLMKNQTVPNLNEEAAFICGPNTKIKYIYIREGITKAPLQACKAKVTSISTVNTENTQSSTFYITPHGTENIIMCRKQNYSPDTKKAMVGRPPLETQILIKLNAAGEVTKIDFKPPEASEAGIGAVA